MEGASSAAVERFINHQPYFTTKVNETLLRSFLKRRKENSELSVLTPRERQVVTLIADGKCCREAAEVLGISAKTAETHRASAMRKLGITTSAALSVTRFATSSFSFLRALGRPPASRENPERVREDTAYITRDFLIIGISASDLVYIYGSESRGCSSRGNRAEPQLAGLAVYSTVRDTKARDAEISASVLSFSAHVCFCGAGAAGRCAEIAKQLANPVASLISVPFQHNFDCCFGPEDAFRYTLNVQPVIPFALTPDWNLIVRTIVPTVYQEAPPPTLRRRFRPRRHDAELLLLARRPSGTRLGVWSGLPLADRHRGDPRHGEMGRGPDRRCPQAEGRLHLRRADQPHLVRRAGDPDRDDVSQTFLQPFVSYTFPNTTSSSLNTETTYDWNGRDGPCRSTPA